MRAPSDLFGSREGKLHAFLLRSVSSTVWTAIQPQPPARLFVVGHRGLAMAGRGRDTIPEGEQLRGGWVGGARSQTAGGKTEDEEGCDAAV